MKELGSCALSQSSWAVMESQRVRSSLSRQPSVSGTRKLPEAYRKTSEIAYSSPKAPMPRHWRGVVRPAMSIRHIACRTSLPKALHHVFRRAERRETIRAFSFQMDRRIAVHCAHPAMYASPPGEFEGCRLPEWSTTKDHAFGALNPTQGKEAGALSEICVTLPSSLQIPEGARSIRALAFVTPMPAEVAKLPSHSQGKGGRVGRQPLRDGSADCDDPSTDLPIADRLCMVSNRPWLRNFSCVEILCRGARTGWRLQFRTPRRCWRREMRRALKQTAYPSSHAGYLVRSYPARRSHTEAASGGSRGSFGGAILRPMGNAPVGLRPAAEAQCPCHAYSEGGSALRRCSRSEWYRRRCTTGS